MSAPAPYRLRAGALAADLLPALAVVAALTLTALTVAGHGLWWWVCVVAAALVLAATAVNRLVAPALTGWTLGRAAAGIVVRRADGTPPGPVRLAVREAAHLLDTAAALVGWLWPLWDSRRRTFADLLTGTEVRVADDRPRGAAATVAVVALAAALVGIGAAALSYQAVYRYERGAATARAEVQRTGPHIIEQLLSYGPASIEEDFARAQALVTPGYRERFAAEQAQARQGTPELNVYEVVGTAVQSATPDRVTQLALLQGQRGVEGHERFLSATLQVTFAKVGRSWLVDDVTVVAAPPAEEHK